MSKEVFLAIIKEAHDLANGDIRFNDPRQRNRLDDAYSWMKDLVSKDELTGDDREVLINRIESCNFRTEIISPHGEVYFLVLCLCLLNRNFPKKSDL